jgi:FkbM family methyltransferase
MTISELKAQFREGKIEKPDFIKESYHLFHQHLFDYSASLAETDIKAISVDAKGVVFTVRSSGIKVRCQPGDHRSPPVETFNFADFEPAESKMMDKLFEGKATFFDIGANIGWHSLTLSSKYRHADFYCFEPIPATYQHLQDNIELNGLSNIHTYNLALSNTTSIQDYYFYTACSGNASAKDLTDRDDVEKVECHQIKLDELMTQQPLPEPEFIKCDVEGAELMVFQGALATLKQAKPIVMAEILRKWSAKYDYKPNEIFTLFDELGYAAFTTDGYTLKPFEEMTDETVETNFFFLHKTKHASLITRFSQL